MAFDDKFQISTQVDVDDDGRPTKPKMVITFWDLLTHDYSLSSL